MACAVVWDIDVEQVYASWMEVCVKGWYKLYILKRSSMARSNPFLFFQDRCSSVHKLTVSEAQLLSKISYTTIVSCSKGRHASDHSKSPPKEHLTYLLHALLRTLSHTQWGQANQRTSTWPHTLKDFANYLHRYVGLPEGVLHPSTPLWLEHWVLLQHDKHCPGFFDLIWRSCGILIVSVLSLIVFLWSWQFSF